VRNLVTDLIFVVLTGRGDDDDLGARGDRVARLDVERNLDRPAREVRRIGIERLTFTAKLFYLLRVITDERASRCGVALHRTPHTAVTASGVLVSGSR
jgi:hypothetical protein